MQQTENVRKAAVLVATLDAENAELLLAGLPPEQADQVRKLARDMDAIDPDEQQEVIVEFRRMRPLVPARHCAGIELDRETPAARIDSAAPAERFGLLREIDTPSLVEFLEPESPQTVAVVLAHLEGERAAEVLNAFAPSRQVDVLRRLADLDRTDEECLDEVERALQATLAEKLEQRRRRRAGREVISGIFGASDPRTRQILMANLRLHDRRLAGELADDAETPSSGELARLGDAEWRQLASRADREQLALALMGDVALTQRVLRLVPPDEATRLRQQIASSAGAGWREVTAARQRLLELSASADGRPTRLSVAA